MGIMLSGYLPGKDLQGLSELELQLLEQPDKKVTAIVVLEQLTVTFSRIDPERDPTLTMRIQSLEPVSSDMAPKVAEMLRQLRADRIGSEQLEAELEPRPEPQGRAARSAKKAGRRGSMSVVPST